MLKLKNTKKSTLELYDFFPSDPWAKCPQKSCWYLAYSKVADWRTGLLCMYVKELRYFPTILNHCPVYKTLPVSPLMFCIQSLLTLVNSVQLCEFQTWIIGKLWRTWLIGTPPSCQWWKEHHMRVSGDVAAVVIWFSSNETNKRQTTPWPTSLLTVSDWARDWTHEQIMTDPSTNPMVDPKISPMINPMTDPMTETMTGTMSPWHTPRPTPWLYPLLTPKIAQNCDVRSVSYSCDISVSQFLFLFLAALDTLCSVPCHWFFFCFVRMHWSCNSDLGKLF